MRAKEPWFGWINQVLAGGEEYDGAKDALMVGSHDLCLGCIIFTRDALAIFQ